MIFLCKYLCARAWNGSENFAIGVDRGSVALARVEEKPEPEQEPTETVIEPEEEPSFWERIPGFPYESIVMGLAVGILVLWLIQWKR